MIKRLISRLRFTRHGLLSLALLPAFLYGTLPHTACICADGHREEHCRALSRPSAAKSASATHCTCCKTREGARSCCQNGKASSTAQTALIAAGTCCQPIVESPAPLVPSAKAQAPAKSTLVASVAQVGDIWSADTFRSIPLGRHLSTPPPPDVVILYLHLTI